MHPDFNATVARSRRKWHLAGLCSPVKFWVAKRRAERLRGQWFALQGSGNTPREAGRNRLLLDILQREGLEVERQANEREAMMLLKGDLL